MRSSIICVDDDKWVLDVLTNLLNEFLAKNYEIEKALSGGEALEIIEDCLNEGGEVSLVISDYIMPGMKGDEFLEQVKNRTPLTRRIMLTGFAAIDGITNAINKAGIYRFMSKPWDNKDMMLTVLQAIRSYEQEKQNEKLASSHKELYHKFQGIAINLQSNLRQAIGTLSAAADMREDGKIGHGQRVAGYSLKVAKKIVMTEEDAKLLETSALLHGIGKLALTDAELEAVSGLKCYENADVARIQAEKARLILKDMDSKIIPGIIYHTERTDGKGAYGKSAGSIPVEARIIGICNYYDTLREAHPDASMSEILSSMEFDCGKVFDARLFEALAKTV